MARATKKLTEKDVDRFPAPSLNGKQMLHWDSELRGFGVLCSGKTNYKSYVVQRGGRHTIGSVYEVSLKQAREEAADLIHALRQGRDPKAKDAGSATLAEAIDAYIARKGKRLRPRTAALYRDAVRLHLKKWHGTRLRDITKSQVEKRYTEIGEERGEAVANNVMRTLRAVINGAGVSPNPVVLKDLWFAIPRRERRVKGDDLARFHEAVEKLDNPVGRDFVKLVLYTGMRRNEATGIRWADVDFADGFIRLSSHRVKNGRTFDVPITDLVRDLLTKRLIFGGGEWVFPSNSKSGHIEEPKSFFKQIEKRTGITVSVHDLRRSYITTADRCVPGIARRALVNHAISDRDVSDGYVGLDPGELAEFAQKVADALREMCGIPKPEPDPEGPGVTRTAERVDTTRP